MYTSVRDPQKISQQLYIKLRELIKTYEFLELGGNSNYSFNKFLLCLEVSQIKKIKLSTLTFENGNKI